MIERKIIICIGTDETRHVRARLSLLLIENGKILSRHYHAISIEPGADLSRKRKINEAHIADADSNIPGAPWPAIPDSEWAEVERIIGIIHTPEVVEKYRKGRG